jgi:outer membrane protein
MTWKRLLSVNRNGITWWLKFDYFGLLSAVTQEITMNRIIIAIVAVLLMATSASSADKIAYVDLSKALNLSKANEKVKQKIVEGTKPDQLKLNSMQDELLKLSRELANQQGKLSDNEKTQKKRDYQQANLDMMRFKNKIQIGMREDYVIYSKQIRNELIKSVQTIGKKGGYNMILTKDKGEVVYSDGSLDLTDELIKEYDISKK